MNRGCGGPLSDFSALSASHSANIYVHATCRGNPCSSPSTARPGIRAGLACGSRKEVLGPRPLCPLERRLWRFRVLPRGGSRSGQVSFTQDPRSGFPAGTELDPNQLRCLLPKVGHVREGELALSPVPPVFLPMVTWENCQALQSPGLEAVAAPSGYSWGLQG